MKTEASVGATLRARSTALRNSGEMPISATESLWLCWSSSWRSSLASRFTITACDARPISTWRWVALNGLGR